MKPGEEPMELIEALYCVRPGMFSLGVGTTRREECRRELADMKSYDDNIFLLGLAMST